MLIERNVQHPQSEEYPLVSFTVESGVTPKTDRYEREQLVKGDKASKKYKETRLDDIVYNPANLKFGAISRNKYGNAVFSPIYVTYEVVRNLALPSFLEMYVTRDSFIKNALQYQQGTVYERMSVNTEDFGNLDIHLPTIKEQEIIGRYFEQLDNLITLHQHKFSSMLKSTLLTPYQFFLKSCFSTLYQPFALPVPNPGHEVHGKLALESLPESSSRPLNSVYYKTIDNMHKTPQSNQA